MKFIKKLLLIFFLTNVFLVSCQNAEDPNVLAIQDDYTLTKEHFNKHVIDLENILGKLSEDDIQRERKILIEMFMDAPEEVLASLKEQINVNPSPKTNPHTPKYSISDGNQKVRSVLGQDIGQMQFDSKQARNFREYLKNSLLQSKSNNYDNGGYRESNAHIQFCADGTFIQALSGYIGIDVEGMSATSGNETDYMPGYWEVASLPNNMFIILLYSTHPSMLEGFPNGFLPFPVAKYTANFVLLPNGDGYGRSINYCN